jgi:hypothetical protein
MGEFLTIARQFEAKSRHEINLFDLGIALLLEKFARPLLAFTNYTPLAKRQLMSPVIPEVQNMLSGVTPLEAEQGEALELIGRGLAHRHLLMTRSNLIGFLVSAGVLVTYGVFGAAVALSTSLSHAVMILGGWLSAMAFTMVVCRRNWHWRPRAKPGVRGGPR